MTAPLPDPLAAPMPASAGPTSTSGSGDERRASRALGGLAVVATVLFAFGTTIGLTVVGRHGGGPLQGWDNRVQTWSLRHRTGLIGVSKVVAYVGDAPKLAVVIVLLALVLWRARGPVMALVPLIAYLGGEAQVFAIRMIVHRHRPPSANFPAPGAIPGVHETSFSFPSGHAVAVTAVLFALAGSLGHESRPRLLWLVALAGSLFVLGTRLVLGVHWFSDVTFGFLIGAAWGVSAAIAMQDLTWADIRELLRRSLAVVHRGSG